MLTFLGMLIIAWMINPAYAHACVELVCDKISSLFKKEE